MGNTFKFCMKSFGTLTRYYNLKKGNFSLVNHRLHAKFYIFSEKNILNLAQLSLGWAVIFRRKKVWLPTDK
jgi:hypothetical protein